MSTMTLPKKSTKPTQVSAKIKEGARILQGVHSTRTAKRCGDPADLAARNVMSSNPDNVALKRWFDAAGKNDDERYKALEQAFEVYYASA